jgi:phosphate-selective porin OprO/OprP
MVHGSPYAGVNYALFVNNGSNQATPGYLADASQKAADVQSNGDGKQWGANLRVNIAEIMGNKEAIMHVGGSIAADDNVTKGSSGSLAFRTNARGTNFFASAAALFPQTLDITRKGLEGIGAYGPFKLQGEYTSMEFSNTGLAASEDKEINAWYVNASYMLTGESYASAYKGGLMDRMTPKADFLGLGKPGWGAWEIGARYSKFNAQDVAVTAGQFVNQAHSYSVGLKWIVDPNTRFLMDYIYTDYQDKFINYNVLGVATAAGSGGTDNEKSVNMRAQFDF